MSKVLIKDIIIPKGTIFHNAPIKTRRIGDGHIQACFGLTKDTVGFIDYDIDNDLNELKEWFREEEL